MELLLVIGIPCIVAFATGFMLANKLAGASLVKQLRLQKQVKELQEHIEEITEWTPKSNYVGLSSDTIERMRRHQNNKDGSVNIRAGGDINIE